MIIFNYHYASFSVESLPRTSFPVLPLIAILWTTFVPQSDGILFIRETDDPENLDWARQLILSQNPDLEDFQPSLAFIVTWHEFMLPNGVPVSQNFTRPRDYLIYMPEC